MAALNAKSALHWYYSIINKPDASTSDFIAVNQSVKNVVDTAIQLEMALKAKPELFSGMICQTTQELLCLNKSVADMMDFIARLEAVLKQKLGIVKCQINGTGTCM